MTAWLDKTEIVAGLVLNKALSPHAVDLSLMMPPYDDMLRRLRDGENTSDLAANGLYKAVDSALKAADAVSFASGHTDWVQALLSAKTKHDAVELFKRASRDLEQGKDPNLVELSSIIDRMTSGERLLVPLSDVEPEKNVWVPTYWEPIDKHIGGMPDSCLSVVAGPPGVGKTALLSKIALATAKAEKDKRVILFSLEMTMGQVLKRMMEIGSPSKSALKRIYCSDQSLTMSQIYAEAATACANGDVAFIGVDFADLVIRGETTSGAMEDVYRNFAILAKHVGVPILLLAQLNDKYVGGIPQVNHLRWSRMAEALAALIILIYNPGRIMVDQGEGSRTNWLDVVPGRGYLLCGKSRFGTKQGALGAIQVAWDGAASWGDKSLGWFQKPGG